MALLAASRLRAFGLLAPVVVRAVWSELTITHNSSRAHQTIELKCISSENGSRFEWTKEDVDIATIYKLSADNSSLYIPDADYDDCGLFTCIARNNSVVEKETFNLVVDGMRPHEYKIITVAIFGLGCLLTSITAFMLSTLFQNTDKKAQKFMIVVTVLFLMGSLTLLLLATIVWIITDGWGIETVLLLVFSLIFMLLPVATFIGKLVGRCQHLWSDGWLPLLAALFVQLMIITMVILIIKKYEHSEEGCAPEWPLLHRLLGALASPFILCLIVFTFRKLVDMITQCQSSTSQEDEESEEEHDKKEDEQPVG
ncbi:uncharacterized protein LOC134346412 [Mobula hypostoma]|uniref:uncharacterized protein LOC134346412 n=1 Tax=Mobula hypostoma TaxID=723540 RepID=UPI002FC34342